jgi:hypothetical protein
MSFETNTAKSLELNSFDLMQNTSTNSLGNKVSVIFPIENKVNLNRIRDSQKIENKIINCENNIENYYFNNINISHDQLEKVVNPYLMTENKTNKTNMNSINNSEFNSLSSINIGLDTLTTRNISTQGKIK